MWYDCFQRKGSSGHCFETGIVFWAVVHICVSTIAGNGYPRYELISKTFILRQTGSVLGIKVFFISLLFSFPVMSARADMAVYNGSRDGMNPLLLTGNIPRQ